MLQDFFILNPRIAVAYSGGVDSSYLLYAAKNAGCDVRAYFVKSQFQPEFERADALAFSESTGVPLTIGTLDVLSESEVASNPPDRCYHCKTAILSHLWELARADGYTILCDGTNADDDESDRPGMRALRELGVSSPLRENGLSKADIRRLSKQAGLSMHDKPSYSCLATRIPTGIAITEDLLAKIERAENALFGMGFTDFRVRLQPLGFPPHGANNSKCDAPGVPHGSDTNAPSYSPDATYGAKLELPEAQWATAATRRKEILEALTPDFKEVTLNLATRP